jgi:hypothetical protein
VAQESERAPETLSSSLARSPAGRGGGTVAFPVVAFHAREPTMLLSLRRFTSSFAPLFLVLACSSRTRANPTLRLQLRRDRGRSRQQPHLQLQRNRHCRLRRSRWMGRRRSTVRQGGHRRGSGAALPAKRKRILWLGPGWAFQPFVSMTAMAASAAVLRKRPGCCCTPLAPPALDWRALETALSRRSGPASKKRRSQRRTSRTQ